MDESTKKLIRQLWRTRSDSFSRHQLRLIVKAEQTKKAEEYQQ